MSFVFYVMFEELVDPLTFQIIVFSLMFISSIDSPFYIAARRLIPIDIDFVVKVISILRKSCEVVQP